jgi:ABC-type phosphonate transport system ATPase subunit
MEDKIATMEIVDGPVQGTSNIVVPSEVMKVISEAPSGAEILNVCVATAAFLSEKNSAYGDSALDPIRVFSKANSTEQLLVRMDDKINRLAKGSQYADEDTMQDLLGYLVLYFVAKARDGR